MVFLMHNHHCRQNATKQNNNGGNGDVLNVPDPQQPLSPACSDTGSNDADTEVLNPKDYQQALIDRDDNVSVTTSTAEIVTLDDFSDSNETMTQASRDSARTYHTDQPCYTDRLTLTLGTHKLCMLVSQY